MIFTCVNTNCRAKFMEEEAYEKDGELFCPECDTPVAKIKEVDLGVEEPGLKSGIDVQPEYVVGARKLNVPKEDKKDESLTIEETSDIMKELESKELKDCHKLDDDEINRIIAEYREELISNLLISDEAQLEIIRKLADEKEADLRFNLTKATNTILRGQQWLLNRGHDTDGEDEYSILGMFDRFC